MAETIASDALWQGQNFPITKQRAIAWVNNPRAAPDDVVLLVAYDNGEVMAYLGVLPDRIFVAGETHKFAWFSTWWVQPSGGGGVGIILMKHALRLYDNHIGVSSYIETVRPIYDALQRFTCMATIEGISFEIGSSCTENLRIQTALECIQANQHVQVEYIAELDSETEQFIEINRGDELTRRGAPELNWLIRSPWILPAPVDDKNAQKYHFSSTSERFQFFSIKVFSENQRMVGFLIIRLRDKNLTVPYAYWSDGQIDSVVQVIAMHFCSLKVSSLRLYNSELIKAFQKSGLPLEQKAARRRDPLITNKFSNLCEGSVILQDGDGDSAFV